MLKRSFIIACAITWASATEAAQSPPDLLDGLTALRQGRFEQAESFFDRVARKDPLSPEGPLLLGFVVWWKMQLDPEDEALRLRMEAHLEEAGRRADALSREPDAVTRARGLELAGISKLMTAQSKAARGSPFSAGSLARQGHRSLSLALEIRPDSPDALFAMGAYNYYADRVSLLIKGLRAILFIPGGNETLGIEQLETAARESRTFGTEALMLLGHIHSGNFEADHRRALDYAREARERHPSSPLIALAYAELLFDLGYLHDAFALATEMEEQIREDPDYPPAMGARAAFRAAQSVLELHDPLGALDRIEIAVRRYPGEARREGPDWARLAWLAARGAGEPPRARALLDALELDADERTRYERKLARLDDSVAAPRARALADLSAGRTEEARRQIESLLDENPRDPRLRYDLGRMLQMQGRLEEASPHLNAAAVSDPGDIAGWAMLRLGWELERTGDRPAALQLYRRAAGLKRFTFRAAAIDRVSNPGCEEPEG